MEKYVVEKVIGEGTYGVVYKAIEKVRLCARGVCETRSAVLTRATQ